MNPSASQFIYRSFSLADQQGKNLYSLVINKKKIFIFMYKKDMMMMTLLSHLLAISMLLSLIAHIVWRIISRRSINTRAAPPPQPSGAWPIIGQLPLHRVLASLTDKYGPVFTIRSGLRSALVISSPEAVRECFTTNDKLWANRPPSTFGEHLGYNYASFSFNHGPYSRQM